MCTCTCVCVRVCVCVRAGGWRLDIERGVVIAVTRRCLDRVIANLGWPIMDKLCGPVS